MYSMYPDIRTFTGKLKNLPAATLKLDFTQQGFHAMILAPEPVGTVYIDPYSRGNTQYYISYYKKNFVPVGKTFRCDVDKGLGGMMHDPSIENPEQQVQPPGQMPPGITPLPIEPGDLPEFGDNQRRQYRLALAATAEYTAFHGGVAGATAAQVTTMNRVNGVYERDIAVRMNIIGNNNVLIFTDAGTDGYTNGNTNAMIGENQTIITAAISSANFDIGHVFGLNSGGLAGQGPCQDGTKARGVTGSGNPQNDPFDIDYVAHEIGHQFGASHTFNNSCDGNRSDANAYEPGSGITIMAYAGICSPNVASNSIDHFHARSVQQMASYITGTGDGCAAKNDPGNAAPVAGGGVNLNVPGSTPFVLTATGSDSNNPNSLSYCWEQYNNEISTQAPVSTSTNGPNFRSFSPESSPARFFPRLPDVVANTSPTWEVLSSVGRTFDFRCVVRDNHPGAGRTDHVDSDVIVDGASGPFTVTYPSASGIIWPVGSSQTITWSVAGSDAAPVNCANVQILLSTDGGTTFDQILVNSTANDGSHTLTVPFIRSTTARIMVKSPGKDYFYDVSNNNFAIAGYDIVVNPNSLTQTCRNEEPTTTVQVTIDNGFGGTVALNLLSKPANLNHNFSPASRTTSGNSTLTLSNLQQVADGGYNMTVQASSGSTSVDKAFTLNLLPDLQVPSFVCPANITVCANQNSNKATVGTVSGQGVILQNLTQASVTDNCPLVHSFQLSGATNLGPTAPVVNNVGVPPPSNYTLRVPNGTQLNLGVTTVTYRSDDGYPGNARTCSFSVLVRKTPKPEWQPTAITICNGAGLNLASYVKDANKVAKRYEFYLGNPESGGTFLGAVTATNGNVNFGQNRWENPAGNNNTPTISQYWVIGINTFPNGPSCPSAPAGPLTVTVDPVPSLNLVSVSPLTICPGQTVTVTHTSSLAGSTFTWTNSNTGIGLAANGNGNISFSAAGPATSTLTSRAIKNNCVSAPVNTTLTVSSCSQARMFGVGENPFGKEGLPQVFPNPSSGALFIKLPATGNVQALYETRFTLFDALGRSVHSESWQLTAGAERRTDISRLAQGIYSYSLSIGNWIYNGRLQKD